MVKLRMEITKGEEIRYIAHLDYARTIERSIRRSGLPVAYSEGFNPHMKMAFASALGVGITSDCEYMDLELKAEWSLSKIKTALAPQLVPGIRLKKVKYIETSSASLMSVVNRAEYIIDVTLLEDTQDQDVIVKENVDRFNQAEKVIFIRESSKGRREMDIKRYLPTEVSVETVKGVAEFSFTSCITAEGTVKPVEVLTMLAEKFAVPIVIGDARIHRVGLYVTDDKGSRFSPLDL